MFNRKLKARIKELEDDLQSARNDAEENMDRASRIEKLLNETTEIIKEQDLKIKQLTGDLDILKNEREEIREKCENAVDKEALLRLYMMKNHDLEMQIHDLENRLSASQSMCSAALLSQSIHNTQMTLLMNQSSYQYYRRIF